MASADRNWEIDGDAFLVGEEEIADAVFEAVRILTRIGGAVIIAANRREVAPHHYVTDSVAFKWTSYAPATRLEQPAPEPQVEAEAVTA